MSREIKFRAWIKGIKRMEYCIGVNSFYVSDCDRMHWKHDEVELMQYTELKDKNGVEIYDGDICTVREKMGTICHGGSFTNVTEWENKSMWIVAYNISCLCNIQRFVNSPSCEIEVIGNIYENSELLETV